MRVRVKLRPNVLNTSLTILYCRRSRDCAVGVDVAGNGRIFGY